MIKTVIVYEDEFLICAVKPAGIPTQPDKTGDMDMVTVLNNYLKEKNIPIAEKILLTLEEAALLTGIGQNKLREISNKEDCPFVLWNGSKRMFKMEKLIAFLNAAFSL